jgi:uncharacterized protein YukE
MNGDTLELMKMKKQIDQAKNDLAQAEGEIKSVLKHLKDKFGCSSKAAAEKQLKAIDKEISKKEDEFLEAMDEIKNNFPWEN